MRLGVLGKENDERGMNGDGWAQQQKKKDKERVVLWSSLVRSGLFWW